MFQALSLTLTPKNKARPNWQHTHRLILLHHMTYILNVPKTSTMSIRSLFSSLTTPFSKTGPWTRNISSRTSPIDSTTDLKTIIFKLQYPTRSATTSLQHWAHQGHKVTAPQLRRIATLLLKSKRYKHAVEILTWMEAQKRFRMSASDHALRMESIIKFYGLTEAEKYFTNLPDTASQKGACLPLLHSYVKDKATEKAEAFMMKLNGLGLIVSPHPFNEMMKLYMATHQFHKVLFVIRYMKQNKIPRNVLSYNLWMGACGEISGVASLEKVYKEMLNDKSVEVGWSTLSTIANIYIKAGLFDNATIALRNAEKMLSTRNRLGYFFLITLYASLHNKEGVLRLWEASKAVRGRITCANYMCILLCLVKLGDLAEAERIFMEWESRCWKYDIRVSNVLLGAYMRNGLMEKAELLHLHALERGGCPNYKTWEILMEGWVKIQNMDKAIDAMKKGFAKLKQCDWRPSPSIVMAIAEYFEKHGNIEDANKYFRDIRRLGLVSLPLYKSLLRVHLSAQVPPFDVLKMMEKDEIEMDGEISALVQSFKV